MRNIFLTDEELDEIIKMEKLKAEMEKLDEEVDNVNHPKHYDGNIQCIDAMQEVLGKNGTIGFCVGNAFKYIWRCRKKHETPIEDLQKCRWYINKALELLEGEVD